MDSGLKGLRTPLALATARFGTAEDREQMAMAWFEGLPPDQADRLLHNAISEWWRMVNTDRQAVRGNA